MQCLVAVIIGSWGVIGTQGAFLPIRTTEVLGKQYVTTARPTHMRAACAHTHVNAFSSCC